MANDTLITLVGNLVDDPELRFVPSGAAVAKFRIASTPRKYDKNTNTWVDEESLFLTCNVWRQPAENVAESLQRGMRVIVQGFLKQRSYTTKEGEKRTVFEIEVEEVGPSLRSATAKVTRAQRQGNGQQGQQDPGGQQRQRPQQDQWDQGGPQNNGWGAQAGPPVHSGWGSPNAPQDAPF